MAKKSHFFFTFWYPIKWKSSPKKVMLKNICHSVGLGERMVFVLRERAKVQFCESGIKCWWRHDIIDSCLKVFQSIRLLPRFIIMGAIIDTLEKKQRLKCHHHYCHYGWHESWRRRRSSAHSVHMEFDLSKGGYQTSRLWGLTPKSKAGLDNLDMSYR